jgi:glycosyltransferase involved in cell wall biosynthesis
VKKIFILVPAPVPTGPVKGAVALANELVRKRSVTLVTLKHGPGHDSWMDPGVKHVSLHLEGGFLKWVRTYKDMLAGAGSRRDVVSISMCLSADMVNLFCAHEAVICSSVRGNLLSNYSLDYGFPGLPLAVAHLFLLRNFDSIVAMSSEMALQMKGYTNRTPAVIGNFIDERSIERYRTLNGGQSTVRFVFLGSLTKRKQPFLLIDAFMEIVRSGMDARLDIIGSGPLMATLKTYASENGCNDRVIFHGQLADPYPILACADALVLPSLSEGISRAAMEALYLGVPCVQRRVDGNGELIQHGRNGVLFERDNCLSRAMVEAVNISRAMTVRRNLLPQQFRQSTGARRFLELIEGR